MRIVVARLQPDRLDPEAEEPRFCPTIRPLFHAGRHGRMAGRFATGMMDPPSTPANLSADTASAIQHSASRPASAAKVRIEP